MARLDGKVAIVTGAAKGIGRATSVELAKAGAKLVLSGIRESTMKEVAQEVGAITTDFIVVQADVSKWDQVQRLVEKTLEKYGRIDILVNNAGILRVNENGEKLTLMEIDEQHWTDVMDVDLKGSFYCIKAVAPTMMAQRSGKIVNLSSSTALSGLVASIPYAAAKAGVMGMTRVLAKELGPYNININAVAPGFILTPMHDKMPPADRAAAAARIPLGKPGIAEQVAQAILFFCLDDLFATGQVLVVDGGSTLH